MVGGYRVGVCGRAGVSGEEIRGLYGVTSLAVRIPHRIVGVSERILPYIRSAGRLWSALFYAAPHVGKTTLIRDLASRLSCGAHAHRVALIDTRGELSRDGMFSECLADILYGYPRGKGIEIATRTLSPEAIFCDEIGSVEEADAILSVQNSGVPLIATAHASSMASLLHRPGIHALYDAGIFRYYIGLQRQEGGNCFSFSVWDTERGEEIAV